MPTEHKVFNNTLARSIQLDVIAYVIIASLMIVAVVLTFMLINSVAPPSGWLLSDPWVQLTGLAFIGVVVIYLLDQHARLRRNLETSHHALQRSKAATERAYKGLLTAHSAAEIMVSVADAESLHKVADAIRSELGAAAVAVVGEEVILSAGENEDADGLLEAISAAAADAVSHNAPITMRTGGVGGHDTLALPLRLLGSLHGVLCVSHPAGTVEPDELDSMRLVARIIELGWESRLLFTEVNESLEGTLDLMTGLIEERVPGYLARTDRIRHLAVRVGSELGLTPRQLTDLKVAVDMRDLGALRAAASMTGLDGVRAPLGPDHPLEGESMARVARLPHSVQAAIRCHHEAFDGTGYPDRAQGSAIPIEARVIRACEHFVDAAPRNPDRAATTQALRDVASHARSTLDSSVAAALTRTVVDELVAADALVQVSRSA